VLIVGGYLAGELFRKPAVIRIEEGNEREAGSCHPGIPGG
jgi:hypothetical protein